MCSGGRFSDGFSALQGMKSGEDYRQNAETYGVYKDMKVTELIKFLDDCSGQGM